MHVQINRRITRSRASKWKRADCIFYLVFFFFLPKYSGDGGGD